MLTPSCLARAASLACKYFREMSDFKWVFKLLVHGFILIIMISVVLSIFWMANHLFV